MKTLKALLVILLCPMAIFCQSPVIDQDVPKKTQTITQDLVVQGSECVGIDCSSSESFGFDTQRYKENNLRVHFDDTSNSASFPNNDWRIIINDSSNGGASYFAVQDATANRQVFRIEAGAPINALYVDNDGDIGIKKSNPVVDLHIVEGNTPTVRLEQDGSDGFTPQTWDLAGNEANFFVRDVTNGSKLPFKIKPNAPTSSIFIAASGAVGIGTESPADTTKFTVNGNALVIGDLGKTGQIIGASDERIKENIQSISQALDVIKNLDGRQYTYKQDAYSELNLPGGQQYGLVAQEVEGVVGNLVKENFMQATDENGNDITLKGIKYQQLIPFLINAIKEQDKVITSQQALISQLMSQSASTEERLAKLESLISGASKNADKSKATADKMDD
ncbi:MAG: tail fiber domain-containing protein [Saprospiraceae bacterium]|nr:tail fiber domain-containing protein [Saprospiraceae bacterium]